MDNFPLDPPYTQLDESQFAAPAAASRAAGIPVAYQVGYGGPEDWTVTYGHRLIDPASASDQRAEMSGAPDVVRRPHGAFPDRESPSA
jgi:hypothetical protein